MPPYLVKKHRTFLVFSSERDAESSLKCDKHLVQQEADVFKLCHAMQFTPKTHRTRVRFQIVNYAQAETRSMHFTQRDEPT